ncbi:MAG: hypothetical protein R3B45_03775 [Bdellovibrionota bacterium]
MTSIFNKKIINTVTMLIFTWSGQGKAVVFQDLSAKKPLWCFELEKIKGSISIPLIDETETISLPTKKIQQRISKSKQDFRVEPIYFTLRNSDQVFFSTAKKYAKKGHTEELYEYLKNKYEESNPIKTGSKSRSIEINESAFQLINKRKLSDKYRETHHNLTIDTSVLKKNRALRDEFFRQVSPYIEKEDGQMLTKKINRSLPLRVDRDLLPTFAKKMVKKFTIFRGPNCFHAALAFQDENFTNSPKYNVKKEKNYHRAMINYDELWRTLNKEFYEIDVVKYPLKYGDIIVFFEVPTNTPGPANFKWIRHTATYLFNGYTFSKGSKSSDTPYTVKKLSDEWETWKHYTQLMAVKIFRKSGKNVSKAPARDLLDWRY